MQDSIFQPRSSWPGRIEEVRSTTKEPDSELSKQRDSGKSETIKLLTALALNDELSIAFPYNHSITREFRCGFLVQVMPKLNDKVDERLESWRDTVFRSFLNYAELFESS